MINFCITLYFLSELRGQIGLCVNTSVSKISVVQWWYCDLVEMLETQKTLSYIQDFVSKDCIHICNKMKMTQSIYSCLLSAKMTLLKRSEVIK